MANNRFNASLQRKDNSYLKQELWKTRTYKWINEWIVAVNIFFGIILAKTTGSRGTELTPLPFSTFSL